MPHRFSSPSPQKPQSASTTYWLAGLVFVAVFLAGIGLGGTGTDVPVVAFIEPTPAPQTLPPPARPKATPAQAKPKATAPRNCTEARARGIAPMYRGEPEYGEWMDGDDDGIACEPYHGH